MNEKLNSTPVQETQNEWATPNPSDTNHGPIFLGDQEVVATQEAPLTALPDMNTAVDMPAPSQSTELSESNTNADHDTEDKWDTRRRELFDEATQDITDQVDKQVRHEKVMDESGADYARWISRAKVYAEGNEDDVALQIKLDQKAGKDPIKQDDIDYYMAMKGRKTAQEIVDNRKGGSKNETGTGEGSGEGTGEGSGEEETPRDKYLRELGEVELTDAQSRAIKDIKELRDTLREEYEAIEVRRNGRAFNFKKGFRKNDRQEAYDKWMKAEQTAGAVVAQAYAAHGFDFDTNLKPLGGESNPNREVLKEAKTYAALDQIDKHTEGMIDKINASNGAGEKWHQRAINKVAEIYANTGDSSKSRTKRFFGKATKAGVLVGIGAGTALALSPLAPAFAVLGAGAGVAALGVSKVARGGMFAKLKSVENQRVGEAKANARRLQARANIEANQSARALSDPTLESGANLTMADGNKIKNKNYRNLAAGAVLGLAGAALIEGYGGDAWDRAKGFIPGVDGEVGDAVGDIETEGETPDIGGSPDGGETPDTSETPDIGGSTDGGETPDTSETPDIGGSPDGGETPVNETDPVEDLGDAAEVLGNTVNVSEGMGGIELFNDIAEQNGLQPNNAVSKDVFNKTVETFGLDGVLSGGVYEMAPGSYGLASSGSNTILPGVKDFIVQEMQAQQAA